nr:alpha-ketoglutarate-dependent dioxygenase AlkB [uncultured Allomuricauda sp.]
MGLFSEKMILDLPQSDIAYYPNFISSEKATMYFNLLKQTISWQQDEITVFGKTYAQPRLTALYGNNGKTYTYSNITMRPNPFTQELHQIKTLVEKEIQIEFSTCLLNYYRDGKDSNGWHSDDEKELGENPPIASISLGTERFFHLRNISDKTLKHKIVLEHGSLLVMKGETQHHWQHQIPKTGKKIGERINLTFRAIK